jgi:hypothetical protein
MMIWKGFGGKDLEESGRSLILGQYRSVFLERLRKMKTAKIGDVS